MVLKAENVCQQVPIVNAEGVDETLEILKSVNIAVQKGESVAIVGASGSGKSTLLAMLAGLDTPSSGHVYLDGQDITEMDEEARALMRAQYVSFVFQDFQLLPSLTALENVMLPLEVRGQQSSHEIRSSAETFLTRVGLSKRLSHYPKQLSGGEQQRVALARAFACEAPILFADEPTGNLDGSTGRSIADLLFELNQESDTTLILVTHDPNLAARCARQFEMSDGQLKVNA